MRSRGQKGSALVDYIIPTAIIGIVLGLGLYSMASSGMLLNFMAASGKMTSNLSDGQMIVGKDVQPGYLGGSATTPKTSCDMASYCNIDYGSYVLTGIPANFGSFVESSGTSGGTKTLADTIEQIADQLQQQGNTQGSKDFRDLSNYVHFMSDVQKEIENKYSNCKDQYAVSSGAGYACLNNVWSQGVSSDSDLNAIFDKYQSTFPAEIAQYRTQSDIQNLLTSITPVNGASNGAPVATLYNKIQTASYPSEMKTAATELLTNVTKLSLNFKENYQIGIPGTGMSWTSTSNFDGSSIYMPIPINRDTVDYIVDPQLAYHNNTNAKIICTTGRNQDVDSSCKP